MKGNFPEGKCNSITKCETGWIVVEMLREKALFKGGRLSVANERSFLRKEKRPAKKAGKGGWYFHSIRRPTRPAMQKDRSIHSYIHVKTSVGSEELNK